MEGKVALVTGGSRGIGAAAVRLFRQAGADVVFSYRSRAGEAEALVAETGGEDHCRGIRQELSTADDGEALVSAATAVFGRLDILVINHGIWPPHDQPIATMTNEQWRGTMGTNLDSVFGLVRAGARQMLGAQAALAAQGPSATLHAGSGEVTPNSLTDATAFAGREKYGPGEPAPATEAENDVDARELLEEVVYSDRIPWPAPEQSPGSVPAGQGVRGHIILVASTAAQRGEAFHADYAASKGALLSLTKSLSSELAPQGILCNCVAPGWVRTEMSAGTLSDPEASKKALGFIPLGRAAEPQEIAGPIVFLCTPWAGFISGEIWNVNGGAVLVG